MTNLQYSFRGKPLGPYEKGGKGGFPPLWLLAIGGAVIAMLLILGSCLLLKKGQPSQVAGVQEPPPVELPEDKSAPPPAIESVPAPIPLKASVPDASARAAAAQELEQAAKLLSEEKFAAARAAALKALSLPEDDPLWDKAAEIAGKAGVALFTSDVPAPEKVFHQVKKGDALLKIAVANNTTIEAIQKANRMAETDTVIHPGQTLSIYKGQWGIKVSKSRCRLYVYDGGRLFKVYPVGIGRQDRTPAGTFELGEKVKNPAWYSKGKKYLPGTPENILGSRWLKLVPTGTTDPHLDGYGIHGTNEPDSVGKSASNGCVRMRNEDVNELFSITPMKTPVEIVE